MVMRCRIHSPFHLTNPHSRLSRVLEKSRRSKGAVSPSSSPQHEKLAQSLSIIRNPKYHGKQEPNSPHHTRCFVFLSFGHSPRFGLICAETGGVKSRKTVAAAAHGNCFRAVATGTTRTMGERHQTTGFLAMLRHLPSAHPTKKTSSAKHPCTSIPNHLICSFFFFAEKAASTSARASTSTRSSVSYQSRGSR